MRHVRKLALLALIASVNAFADSATAPYFFNRSQSEDSARELTGWAHRVNLYDKDVCGDECEVFNYGVFAITPEYTRSFHSCDLAQMIFGNDYNCACDTRGIAITGSRVANRGAGDWLADYFGLPTDYESSFTVSPRIKTYLVDFDFYFALSKLAHGLYFRIHAPAVLTKWNLNFEEQITNDGTNGYVPGYFTSAAVSRVNLVSSFAAYAGSEAAPYLGLDSRAIPPAPRPDFVFNPLENSKITGCGHKKTGLAEIQWALGWNFAQNEDNHIGLNIRGAIPTGTRPKGIYLFEPIVGNGHFWELGLGLTSHITFWDCKETSKYFGLYLDANFTHMFKTHHRRSFDLVNGGNSRYMLAELLGTPVQNTLQSAGGVPAVAQFQNVYTPVANLTTLDVNVSVGIQADITAMLNYTHCRWSYDLGYNFWGRTCEKISLRCDCPLALLEQSWALKGDAHVFGYASAVTPVALSATESRATIHSGLNYIPGRSAEYNGVVGSAPTNPGVDNAQLAQAGVATLYADPVNLVLASQINTSIQPELLTIDDIDFDAGSTKGQTHKIFGAITYAFDDAQRFCFNVEPYLSLGFKVEWAPTKDVGTSSHYLNATSPSACTTVNCCQRVAASEWGIWLKGGASFN